jgi:hypothetical protein
LPHNCVERSERIARDGVADGNPRSKASSSTYLDLGFVDVEWLSARLVMRTLREFGLKAYQSTDDNLA